MKFLYFTDTHIRGTSPRSRTDDFASSMRLKLQEIKGLIETEQVDYVLHGGDVFDRPNLSPSIVREFASILTQFKAPIYVIAGNHDIYGHNPLTVERTMLGLLDAFGTVRLIGEGEKLRLEKAGIVVQLSGQPFHYDLDKRESFLDYKVTNEVQANYCIHMVHGMLVERPLPEGVPHTMIQDVWSDIDVVLTGHYHAGFPLQHKDGKYIINPGALARINNQITEIKRIPQVVLINCNEQLSVSLRPLSSAQNGKDILDRSYLEMESYRQEKLTSFIQQVASSFEFSALDVLDILNEISKLHDVDEEVKREAYRRIAREQEESELVL